MFIYYCTTAVVDGATARSDMTIEKTYTSHIYYTHGFAEQFANRPWCLLPKRISCLASIVYFFTNDLISAA